VAILAGAAVWLCRELERSCRRPARAGPRGPAGAGRPLVPGL